MKQVNRTQTLNLALAIVLAAGSQANFAQSQDLSTLPDAVVPASMEGLAATRTHAVRGVSGDFWADVELGQRDFTEINERLIVAFKLKQPAGVAVDRSVSPGRMYIWDSGNNRILGVDLATCYGHPSPCSATLVFGQPSLTDFGACNRDSSFASYPLRIPASAGTLCGVGEYTHTVLEDKSWAGLFVDLQGNLWVPDVRNHRVLKFNTPFTTDTIADEVWGQADFSGNLCNRQTIYYGAGVLPSPPSQPTASTLCLGDFAAGVTLDDAGNLWVADAGNNRVLRFPNQNGTVAKTADLVIGQPDFTSSAAGRLPNQLNNPSQLRFDPNGNLLVMDAFDITASPRVLKFRPPFSSGMSGQVFVECRQWDAKHEACIKSPVSVEIDHGRNGVWVLYNEPGTTRPLLFNYDGTLRRGLEELGPKGLGFPALGSIGLDDNGDLLVSTYLYGQDVLRITQDVHGQFRLKSRLFSPPEGSNLSARGRFEHSAWGGVAVAGRQLIVADGRLLFWDDRTSIQNGQDADGYLGASSFTDVPGDQFGDASFGQVKTDKDLRIWVTHSNSFNFNSEVQIYQAPLVIGAAPVKILKGSIPVLGGGNIVLTHAFGVAPADHGEFVWISEPANHRVIRVRAPLSANPVVDVILGQQTLAQANSPNPPQCNRGEVPAAPEVALNMLCFPGAISLDRKGNLFVSDHFIELAGNFRLLMFPPYVAPPASVYRMPTAVKAFPSTAERRHATFEPAFDSQNRMVVGFNPYFGPRFLSFYSDPTAVNPNNRYDPAYSRPDGQFHDFFGWPVGMTFDADDNLYAYDANRKLLVYHKPLANVRPVTVVAPNGGENLQGGATFTIRWSALPSVRAVNIEWQPDDNAVWQNVAVGVPNTGAYQWSVPRQPGDQARVRISNSSHPTQADVSNATFHVSYTYSWHLSAQLVCVNGAQPKHNATSTWFVYALWPPDPLVWNAASAGQALTVQSSNSVNSGYLALQTMDSYGDYLVPLKSQAHPALEAGTFFNPPTPMIRWANAKLPEATYTVRFYAPTRWCSGSSSLQFLTPAANQVLHVGHGYAITWVGGSDVARFVKIEFSKDNGRTWYTLTNNLPNRNNYSGWVTHDVTTRARLRISSAGNPKISAISPPFRIVLP